MSYDGDFVLALAGYSFQTHRICEIDSADRFASVIRLCCPQATQMTLGFAVHVLGAEACGVEIAG